MYCQLTEGLSYPRQCWNTTERELCANLYNLHSNLFVDVLTFYRSSFFKKFFKNPSACSVLFEPFPVNCRPLYNITGFN